MYSDSARTSHDRALFLLRSSLIWASWTATRHALAAIEQNAAGGQRRQSAVSADKGVSSETSSSSSEHGSFSCKQVSHYPYLHLNHTCIFKSLESQRRPRRWCRRCPWATSSAQSSARPRPGRPLSTSPAQHRTLHYCQQSLLIGDEVYPYFISSPAMSP